MIGVRAPETTPFSASAAAVSVPTPGGTGSPAEPGTGGPLAPAPVRLVIPRIGVDTPVVPVGLNADGTVTVPPADPAAPAGWYRFGVPPGEPGPAVLLGHVDRHQGPAVFSRLSALESGNDIAVRREDGTTVVFVVESVRTHPKSEFPTEAVYGPTVEPVLRLVTCGGDFDRDRRTYLSNVVVYATLDTSPG
ncbi:class F sortase [Geodermatophilus sp. SYSU D01176]